MNGGVGSHQEPLVRRVFLASEDSVERIDSFSGVATFRDRNGDTKLCYCNCLMGASPYTRYTLRGTSTLVVAQIEGSPPRTGSLAGRMTVLYH